MLSGRNLALFEGIDVKMNNNQNNGLGRSTRGASKLRRDQINRELAALRQLLPLDNSIRERLFQLQVMALSCISIRKAKFFDEHRPKIKSSTEAGPSISPILLLEDLLDRTFLLAITDEGKLLGMSENFALGNLQHISTEEWMAQSDSIFDLIDHRDVATLSEILSRGNGQKGDDQRRTCACRWRAPKLGGVTKRQTDWDGKPTLIEGQFTVKKHQNRRMFLAICRPLINSNFDENSANPFEVDPTYFRITLTPAFHIHSICSNAKFQLGLIFSSSFASSNNSLYNFVHPFYAPALAQLHGKILERKEMATGLLLALTGPNCSVWHFHAIFQRNIKFNNIKAHFQLISSFEAEALAKTHWLYDDENSKKVEKDEELKRPMASSKSGIEMAKEQRVKEKHKTKITTKMESLIKNPADQFDVVIASQNAQSSSFPPPSEEWDDFDQKHLLLINDKLDLNNNHLNKQTGIWSPEEAANLLEDLPTFMLPELDDHDLDEFFRQVEQRPTMGNEEKEQIQGNNETVMTKRRRIGP